LAEIFENKFDVSFIKHCSDYLGEYYSYEGFYCDHFKLLNNELPDDNYQITDSEILIVLKLRFFNGKNKEKQSKCEFMKKQLEKINNLSLYLFEAFEEW